MRKYKNSRELKAHFRRVRLRWAFWLLLAAGLIIFAGIKTGRNQKSGESQEPEEIGTSIVEITIEDIERLTESPDIRVLIQAGNYAGIYHSSVTVSFPSGGYLLLYRNGGWTKKELSAGEAVTMAVSGGDYQLSGDMMAVFVPGGADEQITVESITRNRGTCSYSGRLEISVTDQGLAVVNVLPLETYLKLVVPSEMPASFDGEALKAQAILARTYAYKYLLSPAYEELNAHVDDSISFQVYGNLEENELTSAAVEETKGVLLFYENYLAEVYYYSTSWGFGTDGTVWGGDGQPYLAARRIGPGTLYNSAKDLTGEAAEQYLLEYLKAEAVFQKMIDEPFVSAYESELPWFRWQAENSQVDVSEMESRLKERYASDPTSVLTKTKNGNFESKSVKGIGKLQNLEVYERGEGGIVESVLITGSENTYLVKREYNVRYVLCSPHMVITRQDGVEVEGNLLLPSGFFYILTTNFGQNGLSYILCGGGYGHGVGMSQNGADQMALAVNVLPLETYLKLVVPSEM
ncbi:MAG: SpoIID/LytB domain-containing protein, partial [Lachnospiraceae bacterium]|nr:SpoIID/LytB domain-containing protein [Lachnospiraceae bacterium]